METEKMKHIPNDITRQQAPFRVAADEERIYNKFKGKKK
jgi:hypothetical protein